MEDFLEVFPKIRKSNFQIGGFNSGLKWTGCVPACQHGSMVPAPFTAFKNFSWVRGPHFSLSFWWCCGHVNAHGRHVDRFFHVQHMYSWFWLECMIAAGIFISRDKIWIQKYSYAVLSIICKLISYVFLWFFNFFLEINALNVLYNYIRTIVFYLWKKNHDIYYFSRLRPR